MCRVTDDPPTLLVCMNRASSAYASVASKLSAQQEPLSRLLGGKVPIAERFAAAVWSTFETGAPVLSGCAVAFDCQIADVATTGAHCIGRARAAKSANGRGRHPALVMLTQDRR
nr:flavin reductase family protein [Bradyrhizobium canariense]